MTTVLAQPVFTQACAQGLHNLCIGTAYDEERAWQEIGPCECPCHKTDEVADDHR
jgi:hypothetical protein